MEQLTLSHLTLASEALETAHSMCDSDPLVFNERGVVAYLKKESVSLPAMLHDPNLVLQLRICRLFV
jgi:hypothetical protein